MDLDAILKTIQAQGIRLLGGLIVLVAGLFLARWAMKFIERSERFVKIDPTLKGFLKHLIRLLLYVVVILTAAGTMGIPLTSFLTLLASAGVAVSLAMQGALSNFVGGMTILLLKPFKAGDYVQVGDVEGNVRGIGVFYTEIITLDNRHISLPNSSLTNTAIVNFTREGTRRIDVTFAVSYEADIDRVKRALTEALTATPGILPDPAPIVRLNECADSSLNFIVRVWARSADFLDVNWNLLENGKRALDKAGIEIPYPQMDVHLKPPTD